MPAMAYIQSGKSSAFMVGYDKIGDKIGSEIAKMTKFGRLTELFAGND
jgi:hypothetical protein